MNKQEIELLTEVLKDNGYPIPTTDENERMEFYTDDYDASFVCREQELFVTVISRLIKGIRKEERAMGQWDIQYGIRKLLNFKE